MLLSDTTLNDTQKALISMKLGEIDVNLEQGAHPELQLMFALSEIFKVYSEAKPSSNVIAEFLAI